MASADGPLTVVDGTALLFRAFFGGARGLDARGIEVGAVRAVAARLRRWMAPGRALVVVFDAGPTTFRTALDPSYKAHRGAPPADLVPQFARVVGAVEALGVATWQAPGFEADDLMATLAAVGRAAGREVVLVAVDKDLCQLVCDGPPAVCLEDPWTGVRTDAAGVRARLGVPPSRVTDLLALVGDPTDGVRGVPGIGARTAVALLGDGTPLEAYLDAPTMAVERAPRGGAAVAGRLLAARPAVTAARALVELRQDVPLPPLLMARSAWRGLAPGGADRLRELGVRAPQVKYEG